MRLWPKCSEDVKEVIDLLFLWTDIHLVKKLKTQNWKNSNLQMYIQHSIYNEKKTKVKNRYRDCDAEKRCNKSKFLGNYQLFNSTTIKIETQGDPVQTVTTKSALLFPLL